MTLRDYKIEFEKRFHQKWTSFSIAYHFKSVAADLLNIGFNEVNLSLDQEFPEAVMNRYYSILERLENDEPLQYILGETEFRNCLIKCKPAALIPRPETEELVELVLEVLNDIPKPKVLDVCTGTGCIAISVQQECPKAKVDGLDAFTEVIELAKENNVLNKTEVDFSVIDVLSTEQMAAFENGEFDIWISNPPYIPTSERKSMEQNVLAFEPGVALFVPDEDPLLFYREIALSAKKGLKTNGYLFYEIHEDFCQETIDLLKDLNFKNIIPHKDLQGKSRMISAQNQ